MSISRHATPDPRNWQTETIYEIDVVQAQDLNPDLTFTDAVVHFWRTFQQNVLQEPLDTTGERPSRVAPHAQAFEEDFRVDFIQDCVGSTP